MKDKFNRWVLAVLMALTGLVLGGCAKQGTYDETAGYTPGEGLQDCKVYALHSSYYENLRVVRCPNSTTSTRSDAGNKAKAGRINILVDGVEYAPVSASSSSK